MLKTSITYGFTGVHAGMGIALPCAIPNSSLLRKLGNVWLLLPSMAVLRIRPDSKGIASRRSNTARPLAVREKEGVIGGEKTLP